VYLHTDVSKESDIKAVVEYAQDKFGRLDCMFNNAGFSIMTKPIDETPLEEFDKFVRVHLLGVFLGIKYSASVMKTQGTGSIINTASVAGLSATGGHYAYMSCKAAIVHLSRTVAMELGEHGIRVNSICPGVIATPIFTNTLDLTPKQAEKAMVFFKSWLAKSQPIQRFGMPEDIANAALWLASDESSFVNGHALVVDGGYVGGKMWSEHQTERSQIVAEMMKALEE